MDIKVGFILLKGTGVGYLREMKTKRTQYKCNLQWGVGGPFQSDHKSKYP